MARLITRRHLRVSDNAGLQKLHSSPGAVLWDKRVSVFIDDIALLNIRLARLRSLHPLENSLEVCGKTNVRVLLGVFLDSPTERKISSGPLGIRLDLLIV